MELYPNLIEAIVQNYFKQIASGSSTKDSSGQDMITQDIGDLISLIFAEFTFKINLSLRSVPGLLDKPLPEIITSAYERIEEDSQVFKILQTFLLNQNE